MLYNTIDTRTDVAKNRRKQASRNFGDPVYYVTAPVAQWIARRTSNPEVVGSSPIWGADF